MKTPEKPDTPRGPLEQARAPDGPRAHGESAEKRDQDPRNDPETMPGARIGKPDRRSGEGPPGDPGNRRKD